MGMVVVGTTTGGSGELLVHDETGLVYSAGNPQDLATQLTAVLSDQALFQRLVQAGYQSVCDEFDINRTIAEMGSFLSGLCLKEPAGD